MLMTADLVICCVSPGLAVQKWLQWCMGQGFQRLQDIQWEQVRWWQGWFKGNLDEDQNRQWAELASAEGGSQQQQCTLRSFPPFYSQDANNQDLSADLGRKAQ